MLQSWVIKKSSDSEVEVNVSGSSGRSKIGWREETCGEPYDMAPRKI
jgi:hypothetical protein